MTQLVLPSQGCAQAKVGLRERGYTLIEVMLAVALLGVLTGLALPGYGSYRNKANQRAAAAQVAALQVTIDQYYNDNRRYPPDAASAGISGMLDPWGHAYLYYNIADNNIGGARKDKNLNPINTDYDLYSLGPDGVTKKQLDNKDSVDDIVRARNGAFIGVSAEF